MYSIIDADLFWLDRARSPFTNPAWYVDQLDPDVYLNRAYAPLEKRLRAFIAYARTIPQIAADVRANLRTPLPASFIERGIGGFDGYASFFRNDVAPMFAEVADPRDPGATGAGRRGGGAGDGRPEELAGGRSAPTPPPTSPWASRCSWRCSRPPRAWRCRWRACWRSAARTWTATRRR